MPPLSKFDEGFDKIRLIIITVVILVVAGCIYYLIVNDNSFFLNLVGVKPSSNSSTQNASSSLPTNIILPESQKLVFNEGTSLAAGSDDFNDIKFMGADSYQPLFQELKITSISTGSREFNVTLKDSVTIANVSVTIVTPSGNYNFHLSPANQANTDWTGQWSLDTFDYGIANKDVTMTLSATDDSNNTSRVVINGDATVCNLSNLPSIAYTCALSGVSDLNNDVTLYPNQNIMVLPNSVLVWDPNNSINFNGGYLIILGNVEKGYVYYADNDGDGYGNISQVGISLQTSISKYVRSDVMKGIDCDDSASSWTVSECNPGQQLCANNLSDNVLSRLQSDATKSGGTFSVNPNDLYACKTVHDNCAEWVKQQTCPSNLIYTSDACYKEGSSYYKIITNYNGCQLNNCSVSYSKQACSQ